MDSVIGTASDPGQSACITPELGGPGSTACPIYIDGQGNKIMQEHCLQPMVDGPMMQDGIQGYNYGGWNYITVELDPKTKTTAAVSLAKAQLKLTYIVYRTQLSGHRIRLTRRPCQGRPDGPRPA